MYDDEKVLEDVYRADKDISWGQRSWKVSYERITHTSGALAFQRCVLPVEIHERRWDWSDEGMHNLRLPSKAEKFGPVPWNVELWVYRKFNFLLEEAYQAALETVGFRAVFAGISDPGLGLHCSISGRGRTFANGYYGRFWYSCPAVEYQSACHNRLLGGTISRGLH